MINRIGRRSPDRNRVLLTISYLLTLTVAGALVATPAQAQPKTSPNGRNDQTLTAPASTEATKGAGETKSAESAGGAAKPAAATAGTSAGGVTTGGGSVNASGTTNASAGKSESKGKGGGNSGPVADEVKGVNENASANAKAVQSVIEKFKAQRDQYLNERKTLLEKLKTATEAEKKAITEQLRAENQAREDEERALAKQIREELKALRDERKGG